MTDFEQLFSSFSANKVAVIGDVMLDTYLWGKVERISPEAPVPVVALSHKDYRLGGAANVALNLRALGAAMMTAHCCRNALLKKALLPVICCGVSNGSRPTSRAS